MPADRELRGRLRDAVIRQQEVVEAVVSAGLRDHVKTMIGGAPMTRDWAEKIGADGYAGDAVEAVAEAKRLLNSGAAVLGGQRR